VTRTPQSTASLDQLLATAASRHASDVLLIAGAPAMFRITGALTPAASASLEDEDVRSLVLPLLEPAQSDELRTRRSVDLGFHRENLGRSAALATPLDHSITSAASCRFQVRIVIGFLILQSSRTNKHRDAYHQKSRFERRYPNRDLIPAIPRQAAGNFAPLRRLQSGLEYLIKKTCENTPFCGLTTMRTICK
jgi:hypothetical protein